MMKRGTYLFLCLFLIPTPVFAIPDTTMTISPSAVAGTVVTASDENARNSTISTAYSAHSHTDITQVGNTLNVGDGLAGNKSLCANAADGTDLCIRYNDTLNIWEAQENSTTFSTLLVFSGSNTLTGSNRILLTNANSPALTDAILTGGSGISATITSNQVTLAFDGRFTGTAPTMTSCGTSPSIVGTDHAGKITTGSGTVGTCAFSWATTWAVAPACLAQNATTEQTFRTNSTLTGVQIYSTTDFASDSVSYLCMGNE